MKHRVHDGVDELFRSGLMLSTLLWKAVAESEVVQEQAACHPLAIWTADADPKQ